MHQTARDAEMPRTGSGAQGPGASGVRAGTGANHSHNENEITDAGQQLIKRAPGGYLWNQAYSLWLFVSLLLFEVVARRSLTQADTNVFDLVTTAANLGFYLASLGLSSAASVYIPRALEEGGMARVRALAIRLVVIRLATVLVVGGALLFGTQVLVSVVRATGWSFGIKVVSSYAVSTASQHGWVIAAYVIGVGMANLLSGLLTALVRTRIVFIVGGLGQVLLLACAYGLGVTFGGGVDGLLAAQALPGALTALIYAFALRRVLRARAEALPANLLKPTLQLGVASWLADLPNAALILPIAVGQLTAVASQELLFFKSTYQMGDAGTRFFTDGLGGISTATMSAAYADGRRGPLAVAWRTVNKLQVLLAVPLAAFCVPHAGAIMAFLFGSRYAASGTLLAVYLVINALMQIIGGATQEWVLYVLGKQQWVVASRWISLALLIALGYWLIPRYYALGALLAIGFARLAAAILLFIVARIFVRRAYPWAFTLKILAGMIPPVAFAVAWRPESPALLVAAGAVYFAIFIGCMRLIRPLDAEDGALLTQVAAPLRAFLSIFLARDAGVSSGGGPLAARAAGQPAVAAVQPSSPLTSRHADPASPPDR